MASTISDETDVFKVSFVQIPLPFLCFFLRLSRVEQTLFLLSSQHPPQGHDPLRFPPSPSHCLDRPLVPPLVRLRHHYRHKRRSTLPPSTPISVREGYFRIGSQDSSVVVPGPPWGGGKEQRGQGRARGLDARGEMHKGHCRAGSGRRSHRGSRRLRCCYVVSRSELKRSQGEAKRRGWKEGRS